MGRGCAKNRCRDRLRRGRSVERAIERRIQRRHHRQVVAGDMGRGHRPGRGPIARRRQQRDRGFGVRRPARCDVVPAPPANGSRSSAPSSAYSRLRLGLKPARLTRMNASTAPTAIRSSCVRRPTWRSHAADLGPMLRSLAWVSCRRRRSAGATKHARSLRCRPGRRRRSDRGDGLSRSNTPNSSPSRHQRHHQFRTRGRIAGDVAGERIDVGDALRRARARAAPHTPLSSGMRTQAGRPWNGPTTSSLPS